MAKFPAIPLWTDAYLGDTTHLTTLEHGAYLLLLITAWRSPDCRLPNDDKMLARYTKLSPAQWKRIKPMILAFFTVEDNYIYQGRLLDELDTVKRLTEQRSNAGKASALKRKNRGSTGVGTGSQRKSAPTPTPTPTPIKKDITLLNGASVFFEKWWANYPRKKGKDAAKKKMAAVLRSGKVTEAELLVGLENFNRDIERTRQEPQFIVHGARWLNEGRWADEYIIDEKQEAEREVEQALKRWRQ
jgi:uncharacterized protein YdaU (DUF1376 family)